MTTVQELDRHIAFLRKEAEGLKAMGRPWADGKAEHMDDIAEILLQVRRDKQMTGIGGKRLSDNGEVGR